MARWRVLNGEGQGIEHHDSPWAAQRAALILSAHDLQHERTANYRVEPMLVIPYKMEELNLPDWALEVLRAHE